MLGGHTFRATTRRSAFGGGGVAGIAEWVKSLGAPILAVGEREADAQCVGMMLWHSTPRKDYDGPNLAPVWKKSEIRRDALPTPSSVLNQAKHAANTLRSARIRRPRPITVGQAASPRYRAGDKRQATTTYSSATRPRTLGAGIWVGELLSSALPRRPFDNATDSGRRARCRAEPHPPCPLTNAGFFIRSMNSANLPG
jgi:hypothetical protein